jgi:tetratricopeptide (TPR) repeat protein
MDLSHINRSHAKNLFESIDNKELLAPQTYKVMGVLYLNMITSDRALKYLDKYIKKFPNDGEALFYKGVILKQNKMDYCEYFRRAQELNFELTREIEFTFNLENDPCI